MFLFMIFFYVFFMIPRGASPQVWVGRGAVAGKVAARSVGCAVAPRELPRPKRQVGGHLELARAANAKSARPVAGPVTLRKGPFML